MQTTTGCSAIATLCDAGSCGKIELLITAIVVAMAASRPAYLSSLYLFFLFTILTFSHLFFIHSVSKDVHPQISQAETFTDALALHHLSNQLCIYLQWKTSDMLQLLYLPSSLISFPGEQLVSVC